MELLDLKAQVKRSFSRRTFIKGVIAAGATVSAGAYVFRTAGLRAQSSPGAVERLLTVRVNGQDRRVEVNRQETLATTLRYRLGLTGTKIGCDRADCGACTVLVDGVPKYSCSLLTHQVRAGEVTTIEGLADGDQLHPVQQAVLDEAGFQCAFCASGFIMSMTGYLMQNPNPTIEQMQRGISGNICRCADYPKILQAAMRAAEYMRNSA
jgi:aerobic-type carbon monoxide dehydrogenase small subunit (CoxS/CutS family)